MGFEIPIPRANGPQTQSPRRQYRAHSGIGCILLMQYLKNGVFILAAS